MPSDGEDPKVQVENWSKTLEMIDLWLEKNLGVAKSPLSNIFQRDSQVKEEYVDPRTGEVGSVYIVHGEEMIARAPHFINNASGPFMEEHTQDNRTVWDLLVKIYKDTVCWFVSRPYQRDMDGRNAFLALG